VPTSPQAGLLLLFVNLCGFVINSATIPGGWIAVYWANPVTYMFTSLAVNEFTSPDWATPVDGTPIGEIVLQTRGYQQKYLYVWLAIFVWGAAASVLNFVACVFFLATLPAPKPPVVMSEEAYELQLKARAGLDAELPEELRGSSKRKKGSTASLASLGKSASHPSLPGTAPPPAASDEDSGKLGKAAVGDVESQGPPASQGGSSLPFKPLSMTFADVRYSVPYPKDAAHPEGSDKQEGPHAGQLLLLKGITGSFRAGVLTALMGASGAGKTTLMDVLAGRKTGGTITGDIRVNGFPQDQATFARVAGYCEQTDIHVPHTSVHEALQFSARLRLPSSVTREQCEAFVREVMDLVELTSIKNAIVGLPGVGLSVEQVRAGGVLPGGKGGGRGGITAHGAQLHRKGAAGCGEVQSMRAWWVGGHIAGDHPFSWSGVGHGQRVLNTERARLLLCSASA
jgi:ABC-type multidrug transport system fused ATPase/permease subunit